MQFTVVNKIILGFAALAFLLLLTSVVSFFDLSDIRHSAKSVVEDKGPTQTAMREVQTSLLSLANLTTEGFYLPDRNALEANQSEFNTKIATLKKQLGTLRGLVSADAKVKVLIESAETYASAGSRMFSGRLSSLLLAEKIAVQLNEILNTADEAGALMMDISYLEGEGPSFDAFLGTSRNIDNKLVPLGNATKEYVSELEKDNLAIVEEDITYSLSNVEADSTYLNRLAEEVPNDGIVEMFNEQFTALRTLYQAPDGLFSLQQQRLDNIYAARADYDRSVSAINAALEAINSAYLSVAQETLAGQKAILDNVNASTVSSIIIAIIGLIAVVGLGTLATRSIAKPLARVNRSLAKISAGDLTQRVRADNDDEFGELAESVNTLTSNFRKLIGEIISQGDALSAAAASSIALGDESLQQVDIQREQVQQTASNTQSVKTTSQTNLAQVRQSMEELEAISQKSVQAVDLVAQCRQQVNEQSKQAQSSEEVIKRLDANSHNIVGILDVIKTIAEQTNLLALNAAIEAARAGEQGRGFAVVADEVRTLATRTQSSTQEIESMIDALQKDAGQAVSAIGQGRELAIQSVTLTEAVGQQIEQIGQVITELTAINQGIVTDTNQQDKLLEDVAAALQRIVDLAEQSADSSVESNAAAQQVSQHAQRLQTAVSEFKL